MRLVTIFLFVIFGIVGCKAGLTKDETQVVFKHCNLASGEHQKAIDKGVYDGEKDLAEAITARHRQACKLLEEALKDD